MRWFERFLLAMQPNPKFTCEICGHTEHSWHEAEQHDLTHVRLIVPPIDTDAA
jgi:hypothetical protein